MKLKIILFLLPIAFLSCKKEKQQPEPDPEVSIQGKWTGKKWHYEYFNAAGTKVHSDDEDISGLTFQFGMSTVIYGRDPEEKFKSNYTITMNGSKKILTINTGALMSYEIRTLDKSNMVWYQESLSNGGVYHNGVFIQFTKSTEVITLGR